MVRGENSRMMPDMIPGLSRMSDGIIGENLLVFNITTASPKLAKSVAWTRHTVPCGDSS